MTSLQNRGLQKCPSGIPGLDEITAGGLPRNRTTLVCGGAGCGKTLLGVQFLVRGAVDHGEPGVLITFEESEADLAQNVASLGMDLDALREQGLLAIDHVRVERSEIEETGEYSLDGLFIRLELAIQTVGARRVVIDTLEVLFAGLRNHDVLRAELRRLFAWLKARGVTAIVTAERGEGTLTRHGLEEYVSDCVIVLDQRIEEQIATRRLRVLKYRGSLHGANEFPFLIDEAGLSVLPITSAHLLHAASTTRVGSGIPRLDSMLGGGFFAGSTILVSGSAGCGKTILAGHFADATCRRGERVLFVSFEEAPAQLRRNLGSVGLDFEAHEAAGRLRIVSGRATTHGLETHLAIFHREINELRPSAVVIDPVNDLLSAGRPTDAHLMLVRLVDYLKSQGITALMTSLAGDGERIDGTDVHISSIVDTWLLTKSVETIGERNRSLYVLKSRGTSHSNQVREFLITGTGVQLLDVSLGPDGVLTGTARMQQEARDLARRAERAAETTRLRQQLEHKSAIFEARLQALRAEHEIEAAELQQRLDEAARVESRLAEDRVRMGKMRGSEGDADE